MSEGLKRQWNLFGVNITKSISSALQLFSVDEAHLTQKTIYEIKPSNFETLPDEKQLRELNKFFAILRTAQKPIRILMMKEPLSVEFGNETSTMSVERTFIQTNEPMDSILSGYNMDYSVVSSSPVPKLKSEEMSHVVFEDGSFGKWFTLWKMPSTLPPAWIHTLLPNVDMISIFMSPIENHIAISTLHRITGLTGSAAQKNINASIKFQNAIELLNSLSRSETRMFTISVCVLIKSYSLVELKNSEKTLNSVFRTLMASFEGTLTLQGRMNDFGLGKKLQFELGSSSIFYPFVSADMVEVPNGILLGKNLDTGAPVIYDYTKRPNHNMVFLAASGAGKSVTMKTAVTRLMEKYPTAYVFIVDPNGEYDEVGRHLGIPVLRITGEENLGFDPFGLFKNAEDAADMVSEISKAPDLIRKQFRAKAMGCKSIDDLYNAVDDEGKKWLVDLVSGSTKKILSGESKLGDRVIISLKGTTGEERTGMLLLFALGRLWKEIQRLPKSRLKILVVDEGWLLFKLSSAGKFLEIVARTGRKENVVFMFATQQPEDVLDDPHGIAIASNADTKFILGNTEQATQKIRASLGLSVQEAEMLLTFQKGQCLLLTKDHRLRVQITPSKEELVIFSTSPSEQKDTPSEQKDTP